jgi:hypothetical protein
MDPGDDDDEPDLLDLISGEEEEAPARRIAHWCGCWVWVREGRPAFCTYCGGW